MVIEKEMIRRWVEQIIATQEKAVVAAILSGIDLHEMSIVDHFSYGGGVMKYSCKAIRSIG